MSLRRALGSSLWVADRAEVDAQTLSVSGWVISPTDNPDDVRFVVNGRTFESLTVGKHRPDLPDLLGFIPRVDRAGFEMSTTLTLSELSGQTPIEIDAISATSQRPLRPWQSVFCLPASLERWPLPDVPRIKRVHGAADEAAFRLVGYSNFRKLNRVLEAVVGKPMQAFPRILDWGCGSGRLMRYASELTGVELTGADIDSDNLAWCQKHLPFATHVQLPLHPPSALADQAFDLLVGLSVFTHLNEDVQFEWLKELQRVSAPDAVLLMSIHGPTVHAMSGSADFCDSVVRQGIIDGRSYDMDDVIKDRGYYRTTHISHEYIRRVWSNYFELIDILPACLANVHDVVVMRRRA